MLVTTLANQPGSWTRIAYRFFALGFFLLNSGADSAIADEQAPIAQRLFAEAPKAWEDHQLYWLTLEGTGTGAQRLGKDGKWTTTQMRSLYKQCNGCMLDQFEILESGSWKGFVRGENSDYIFVLGRTSDQRPWMIQEVNKKVRKSPDAWNARKTNLRDLFLAARTPILPQIFQSPRFKCRNVTSEPTHAGDLVRMTFTFNPEGTNRLHGGWVVLDPLHYWVIRKSEVELDLGENRKGAAKWPTSYDYKEGSNHHPILTTGMMKCQIVENGLITEEAEYPGTADLHERAFIPESEFTLTAYGLPEPS